MLSSGRVLLAVLLMCGLPSAVLAQKEYGFDNTKSSGQPYLKPDESVKRMKVADGFEVKLFAAEPMVINPIAMTVDEKGRVWVIESFEYPKRTPKGKMPRDRIVILEDTKGTGVADKRTVFAEGKDFPERFDLASGLEVGHGGVFVGAPPYLWFIENKNDKPGKFTKLLSGFGSEDTHETLNTFQWGPDGRLYGLHGVFTQSMVAAAHKPDAQARVKLNAGVWRYDVRAKKFEVFAEGTSNPWGMDYRNTDGQFILCCCVIPHLFHISPGGIYKRQAGVSNNPYAYGYINEICDHTFHKESGWAHAGLISLDTPLMPKEYRDSVIFGSIHGCSIKRNVLKKNGSTYTASRADDFLKSGDKNFRPINLRWGHNGEIYCSDWHDQHPCHQTNPDDWDYEHGRIYRIQPKGLKTKKAEDLGKKKTDELLQLLYAINPYISRTALRLIGELPNRPKLNYDKLYKNLSSGHLPSLWAALILWRQSYPDGVADRVSRFGIEHQSAAWRCWAYRAAGETYQTPRTIDRPFLGGVPAQEKAKEVRLELAAAALRVGDPGKFLHQLLLSGKEDARDPVIPQMIWLAYEPVLASEAKTELAWLKDNAAGNALITDTIVPRSMRRLVATGKPDDLALCLKFVSEVKDKAVRTQALSGLAIAFEGRTVDAPAEWAALQERLAKDADETTKKLFNKLAVAFRDPKAARRAHEAAHNLKLPSEERAEAVRQLVLLKHPEALKSLLTLLQEDKDVAVRAECARSLVAFDDPKLANEIVSRWSSYPKPVREELLDTLAARKEWSRALLKGLADKKIGRMEVRNDVILRIVAHKDKTLTAEIEKVWGKLRETPKELAALIDKMRGELYKGRASFERGRKVFENQCAKCHQFEGKGHEVGPSLDGADRSIEYLLINVLDPNRVIGQPYYRRTIALKDGTVASGILAAEDDKSVTLKGENAVLKLILKKDIEEMQQDPISLMPEGLDKNMTVQDFRDLIRYVMANPFLTDVAIAGPFEVKGTPIEPASAFAGKAMKRSTPVVGPPGRIPLPAAKEESSAFIAAEVTAPKAMKTRLQLGAANPVRVWLNGKEIYNGKPADKGPAAPDQAGVEVELKAGVNQLMFRVAYKGDKEALYARLLDPERKLTYAPPKYAEK
jgi:putative membrane-bound dehydrogenase-like protein